ncbi:MAG: peptidoglycan DD-metalloendopeptidase family protein [Bacteroidia bacterium]
MKRRKIIINPPEQQPSNGQEVQPARMVIRSHTTGMDSLRQEHEQVKASYQRLRRLLWVVGVIVVLLVGTLSFFLLRRPPAPDPDGPGPGGVAVVHPYGFDASGMATDADLIVDARTLDEVLLSYNTPAAQVGRLTDLSRRLLPSDTLHIGSRLTVITDPRQARRLEALVYEPTPFTYYVFHAGDSAWAQRFERKRSIRIETASGIIDSVLWMTFYERSIHYELINRMEEALQWAVDFYHLQPGDRFKLLYDGIYAGDELVGVDALRAVYFRTGTQEVYAYYFDDGRVRGFFDEQARPMRRTFLKSPVKYARISSPFNKSRYHPVLNVVKEHLGTDYAAPEGTPILSVADGVVSAAAFTENNGNYVKIRHDKTYETQYLHMSRFADGLRVGTRVQQGEVIGYVGSTGLASGPHVCFRFWKNNQQVNHLAENLPFSQPLPTGEAQLFFQHRDSLQLRLNALGYY